MATRRTGLFRPSSSKTSKSMPWTPEDHDIIIPIMGPTGAGKSTFINSIAGEEVARVGHDLKSCTSKLQPVVIDSSRTAGLQPVVIDPSHKAEPVVIDSPHTAGPQPVARASSQSASPNGRRLVLVDTPGFGDTYVDDAEILRLIGYWLETMYGEGKTKLAGVIYLHDISLARMLGTTRKNLDIFQKLCGDGALRNVVLCTTKWSDVYEEDGDKRTTQLCDVYWKEMIDHGSAVHKFGDTKESAWEAVNLVIDANQKQTEALQIQKELVDALKLIPDTEAGRQLRYSLRQLLTSLKQASKRDSSRREELDAQIAVIRHQIKEMRIPVTVRLLGVLDLGVDKVLNTFTITKRIVWSAPKVKKLQGKSQADESTVKNRTHPSTVPPVGARLGADVDKLILLLGETGIVNKTVIECLSAKATALDSASVRCWSVKRGDWTQFVVEAPGFDSRGGVPWVFQKVRTWLSNSCREDMQFGIICLQQSLSSVSPSPSVASHSTGAMELVKRLALASNTLFATLTAEEQTADESGDATSQAEYTFSGSVASFQKTREHVLDMLDIALEKPVRLGSLLSGLHENANAEVLILVMGGARCGKSTFINSAAGETLIEVNNSMIPSPTIQHARCPHPTFKKKIILVESPGFDHTDDGKVHSGILVDTAKWLTESFNAVTFGGILYLQQKGQARPMLMNLRGNDTIKRNLLHVVTNPVSSSGSSVVSDAEKGDAEFPYIRGAAGSEPNTSAWTIIDQVLRKVEPRNLTVDLFHHELCEITGTADKGENEVKGGGKHWFKNPRRSAG